VFNPSAILTGASGAQINYIAMKSNQFLLIQAKLRHSRPKESRTASCCANVISVKTEREVRRVGMGAGTLEISNKNMIQYPTGVYYTLH